MPKVRLLVQLADPLVEGNMFAQGEVVDVSEEQAAEWKADGKVSVIADEAAAAKAADAGHYSDRTGREDTEPSGQYGERTGRGDTEPLEPEDVRRAKGKK
jgi:hypothetical protein